MKILFLIDNLGSGGAQRQMITLAEMLKEKNHDISFVVYYKFDFFKDKLDKLNIPVHYILESKPLYRIFKIAKYIQKGRYDVVISFLATPNFLNCISALGGKSWKVITSERSSKLKTFLSRKGKLFAWFQRYSNTIICNSYNSKAMWEQYYPQYKDKLTTIYNPVLLPQINSEYIPKRNGKLNIIVAASYQYLKNPIGLVRALAMMNQDEREKIQINWYGRIEIVHGDTQAFNEATALIKENKLQNVIHLNESTKDIANIMYEADIVALFSEMEGLPNAICEGMMIGKPIIMTRVSDYNNLVDESNGILCDWDKPESIKIALNQAIQWEAGELIEKGENSRRKAEKLFDREVILSKWLNCF